MTIRIFVFLLGIVLLFSFWYLITNRSSQNPLSSSLDNPQNLTENPSVQTFNIKGSNYSFDLKEIKVKQGQTVRIIFSNEGGMHDWVLNEFNARTPQINSGQTSTIEFVADKAGTYEYYCSVGNHRAMGMKGVLIVE